MCGKQVANLVKGAVKSSLAAVNHGIPKGLQPKLGGNTMEEIWDDVKSEDGSMSPLGTGIKPYLGDVPGLSGNMYDDVDAAPGVIASGNSLNPIGIAAADPSADPNPSNWMNSSMLAGGSKRRKDKNKRMGMQSTILTGGSGIYSNTA